MRCPDPQCGTENVGTAKFCRACGAALAIDERSAVPAAEPLEKQCPACGRTVPAQARFCGKCGCPIPSGPPENVEALIEPRRAVEPEPTVPLAEPGDAAAHIAEPAPQPETTPAAGVDARNSRKPIFLASAIGGTLIVGALAVWFHLGRDAPPATGTAIASPISATPMSAPPEAPAPATVVGAPAATAATASQPFQNLLAPAEETQANPAPASEAEARARAERTRKRREARLAREAAEREARAAALRSAEAAPPPPSSVKEICAGETSFLARNSCEARVCQIKEWMFSPYCVQRRQMEEQKRQGIFGGSD